MLTLVDPGLGNAAAVENMFIHLGIEIAVARTPAQVDEASALILPGVGSFDAGMERLKRSRLDESLDRAVRGRGLPILGICLGFQLMGRGSEEGATAGFGWLDAVTVRLDEAAAHARGLRVPHQGWGEVVPTPRGRDLFGAHAQRFYFSHSYHVRCDRAEDVLATAEHGELFTAAAGHGPVLGVQFHPEKSHRFGLGLLSRFAATCA